MAKKKYMGVEAYTKQLVRDAGMSGCIDYHVKPVVAPPYVKLEGKYYKTVEVIEKALALMGKRVTHGD